MSRLANRIQKLEVGGSQLSPLVKAWLGQPLTDGERALTENDDEPELDMSTLDSVTRDWLGTDGE
ncbi:MAG: hypothetical protein ACSHW2_09595 [Parasphingopyxis sp.]